MFELNEHTGLQEIEGYLNMLLEGRDAALVSEAGLPAVADPGAQLVALAHKYDVRVVPLSGPSSLMMALMSSGLNGQCFAFTGYLPVKSAERRDKIKTIERISLQLNQSQIIIETPYRNDALLADMLQTLSPGTRICIAADISLPTQTIRTESVESWRRHPISIGKRPCVFIILA